MDQEKKHTPGPCRARRTGGGFAVTYGLPGREITRVAFCESDDDPVMDEQTEADANLIAAAPDLLAALKSATAALQDAGQGAMRFTDTLGAALDAIAKAEGRQ